MLLRKFSLVLYVMSLACRGRVAYHRDRSEFTARCDLNTSTSLLFDIYTWETHSFVFQNYTRLRHTRVSYLDTR